MLKWTIVLLVVVASLVGNLFDIFFNGFPIRQLSFILVFFVLAFNLVIRPKFNVIVYLVFISLFVLVGMIVSTYRDVEPVHYIGELMPYTLPLLSYPLFKYLRKVDIIKVKKITLQCLYIFSVIHLIFVLLFFANKGLSDVYYGIVKYYFDSATHLNALPYSENNFFIPRLQVGMSILLFFALYLKLDRSTEYGNKKLDIYFVVLVLGVLVTQSRAIVISLLGFFILAKLLVILISSSKRKSSVVTFSLVLVLILPQLVTASIIGFDIVSLLGLARGNEGDSERLVQLYSFIHTWSQYPLLGQGLGTASEYVRSPESPWIYELGMISFVYKLGGVGLVMLLFSILIFSFKIKSTNNNFSVERVSYNLSFLFFFLLASNTNPYIQNFAGGIVLMITFINFMDINNVERTVKY